MTDTVIFIPHQIPIPTTSLSDYICQAPSNIVILLTCPPKNYLPPIQLNDTIKKGLLQLSTILNCNEISPNLLTKQNITYNAAAAALISKSSKHHKSNIPLTP